MAWNPIKDDIEYLWEVAGRTEQFAQLVVGAQPSLTGDLLTRANAAAAAATKAREALQGALNQFTGPYPPIDPVAFWQVTYTAKEARDLLVVVQSTLADIDRKQKALTGRELQTFPAAEESHPGILQQVGVAARNVAIAVGVCVVAMVAFAIIRR
jgi:hypothetical protein